jgi:beta-lactamase superfamily II metal-dependent hydrolase
MLPASYGDSILINYGQNSDLKYILIDGGPYYALKEIGDSIKIHAPDLKEIELLIVTHIDADHIDGIIRMLHRGQLPFTIKEIWFNGYEQIKAFKDDENCLLGYKQGEYLSALIKHKNVEHNKTYFGGKAVSIKNNDTPICIKLAGGFKMLLLGPDEETLAEFAKNWEKESANIGNVDVWLKSLESNPRYTDRALLGDDSIADLQAYKADKDDSLENRTSIVFIGVYAGRSCLFAGDKPNDAMINVIQPLMDKRKVKKQQLELDAWKVAHHGSRKSTLYTLMQKLSAPKLLISSDGKYYGFPNQDTIAKFLMYNQRPLTFYFNYLHKKNERWDNDDLRNTYHYETEYGKEEQGIKISLIPPTVAPVTAADHVKS